MTNHETCRLIWWWWGMRWSDRINGVALSDASAARSVGVFAASLAVLAMLPALARADDTDNPAQTGHSQATAEGEPAFTTELIRGRVVWLAAALQQDFGISTVPEVAENSLAIRTKEGQLIPIVENIRGRAFRSDERLREMDVEVLARRYRRQPLIQVLRLYQVEGDQRYEIDYWCDVCAIVMFETGPCACCQDDNRLRKRLVEQSDASSPALQVEPAKE